MKQFLLKMEKYFLTSVQFLTSIPLKTSQPPDNAAIGGAIALFPLTGALIGLVLAVSNAVFSFGLPSMASAALTVVVMALLTGALHQDGIADTVDGIFGGKDPAKRLDIMRDSRIGTYGVLALVLDIALKIALIAAIPARYKTGALIAMAISGRWSVTLALYITKYARPEGKAKAFFEATNNRIFAISTVLALALAFGAAGLKGAGAAVAAGVAAYAACSYLEKKIGGMTGDTLGAVNEIAEIVALITIAVMAGTK